MDDEVAVAFDAPAPVAVNVDLVGVEGQGGEAEQRGARLCVVSGVLGLLVSAHGDNNGEGGAAYH